MTSSELPWAETVGPGVLQWMTSRLAKGGLLLSGSLTRQRASDGRRDMR